MRYVPTMTLLRGHGGPPPIVRRNPLLAIVGNPAQAREVHPLAYEARDRYREDMGAGHDSAAEYWRGQAGAFFTGNPHESWAVYREWDPVWGGSPPPPAESGMSRLEAVSFAEDMNIRLRLPLGRRYVARPERSGGRPLHPVRGYENNPSQDHHRRAAMDLIHRALEDEDFGALREAHGHIQAAYRCCSNPPRPEEVGILDEVLGRLEGAEDELFEKLNQPSVKAVAGSGKVGRVKGRVKKNFKASKPKKSKAPRKRRYSLEAARKKFKGFDKAISAYRQFHDREPGHVDVYELEDGESVVTVDDVHAALHRTLETNYLVPEGWDSNKNGSFWKHEHIEGAMEGKIDLQARIEDLPLEVFDVKRNRTIKLPNGRWYVSDWWRERRGRGERRKH